MDSCFEHLDRIEFVITDMCTGNCKHCSEGDRIHSTAHIDGARGAELVRTLCRDYPIASLMTFGGEPLLYPETVFAIQTAARDAGIPKRHVITNGYFSRDEARIRDVASGLFSCGVTKVMLSVDAFHAETVPLDPVLAFAKALYRAGVPTVTHPAWLGGREDDNTYNRRTRELLSLFSEIGISPSKGNIIFPAGNARRYLADYFDKDKSYINPYAESPDELHTVSVCADGSVLGGNLYDDDIRTIMQTYDAQRAPLHREMP